MDVSLNETQQLIQRSAREFSERRLSPCSAQFEAAEQVPAEVLNAMARLGLMGVTVPEALGGSEAGALSLALALAEVSSGCASTAVMMAVTNMVAEIIVNFGTEAQKAMHVSRIASGAYLTAAFALSEPGAGSDPAAMTTVAHKHNGHWQINGNKQWISNGTTAGVFVVWARTGAEAAHRGISCFLVPANHPGLVVGSKEDKMGLRASDTVTLAFDGCTVDEASLLGKEGDGFRIAMAALDGGRINIAAQCL